MLGHRQLKTEDYLKIIRRRWLLLVIPTIVVGIATYFVANRIPDRYTSQTLVLVQEQTVPDSIVKASANGELNQRLASMQEQILSRNSLEPLVRRYDLLSDSALPMEDKVDELRKNIVVTPVMPMAETRANSLPGFFITVTQSNARIAQQVCSDITSMFIEKDLENRQSQATDTTKFLANTLADAKQKLDETDSKLAALKQKFMGEMPDEEQTNLSLLASVNTPLEGVNQTISRDQQEKTIDEALINQQIESAKQNQQGVLNPETLDQQLQQAQAALAQLQSKYTDSYPDVIAKKAEIEEIKRQIVAGSADAPVGKSDAKPKEKAADSAAADKTVAASKPGQDKTTDPTTSKAAASSPQLTQLRTSVLLLDQQIRDKTKQQAELQKQIAGYEARLRISPLVEEQYKQLTRDYQTALDFYNSLLKQNDQATMARDLQNRQQGEMFKVLDPASLPEKPSYPNRPEIVGGGFGGGLALGLAMVLLLELRDKSIRSEDDVEFFLKVPTLAIVPIVESMKDGKGRLLQAGGKQSPPLQAST
jgi:polysaccharide chain length determinant protein (PEP-CTERM system associated)